MCLSVMRSSFRIYSSVLASPALVYAATTFHVQNHVFFLPKRHRFVVVPLAHSFAPSWGKRQPYWVKGGGQVFCSLSSLEPAAILGHGTTMFLTFPRQRLKCNFLFSACPMGRAPQGHQYLPWKQLYTIFHPPQTHILRSERNTTAVALLFCSFTTSRVHNGARIKRLQSEKAQSPLPRLSPPLRWD